MPDFAGFAGFVAALSALSLGVTKAVDFIRNIVDPNDKLQGSWVWNAVAFVAGVALCVGWELNLAPMLVGLVPALSEHASELSGLSGQILTGLLVGGGAGFFHELLSALSSVQTKNDALAASTATYVEPVTTTTTYET